jgi:hypothetical protein
MELKFNIAVKTYFPTQDYDSNLAGPDLYSIPATIVWTTSWTPPPPASWGSHGYLEDARIAVHAACETHPEAQFGLMVDALTGIRRSPAFLGSAKAVWKEGEAWKDLFQCPQIIVFFDPWISLDPNRIDQIVITLAEDFAQMVLTNAAWTSIRPGSTALQEFNAVLGGEVSARAWAMTLERVPETPKE